MSWSLILNLPLPKSAISKLLEKLFLGQNLSRISRCNVYPNDKSNTFKNHQSLRYPIQITFISNFIIFQKIPYENSDYFAYFLMIYSNKFRNNLLPIFLLFILEIIY